MMVSSIGRRIARLHPRIQATAGAVAAVMVAAGLVVGAGAIQDDSGFERPRYEYDAPETVPQLEIATVAAGIEAYDRDTWRHWQTRSCRTTRNQVLVEETVDEVIEFKPDDRDRECVVASGQWVGLYGDGIFTDPKKLDVDHLVPLKNAHLSGAWEWDEAKKKVYANYLEDSQHLIAVEARLNREKGAKGPDEWQPPNIDYRCQYAVDWIVVKDFWELTATLAEWDALKGMLETCDEPPEIE